MRANVIKAWLAIGTLAIASGCRCGEDPCDDVFIAFESPKDGMIDVPSTTDVTVKVVNAAGVAVELQSAQLAARSTSATQFSAPKEGTIAPGTATFAGFALEPGPNDLKVTVKNKEATCTGTKTITIVALGTDEPPKVLTFSTPQDTAAPAGVLNSLELPTTSALRIALTTQFANGAAVEILNGSSDTVLGTGVVANSAAVIDLNASALADGQYALFARLTRGTATNTQAGNPEAVKAIAIDRTLPTCSVTTEKAVVGPNDDADLAKPGYQVRATATANAKARLIEIKLSSPDTTGPQPFTGGSFTADLLVPGTGTGVYELRVEATDSSGNICSATAPITTDFVAPTVVITSPTAGSSPYATFNLPLTATTAGAASTVRFFTSQGAVRRELVTLPVVADAAAGVGSFLNGAQVVEAVATDAVGNASAPVAQNITVNAPGCGLTFSRPSTNPVTLTQVNNATPGAPTLSYALEVTSTPSCAGKNVSIRAVNNAAVAPQSLSGVTNASGVYRSPNFVIPETAPGTVDFEAQIDDGAGVITKTVVTVTVNLQAPSLTFPTPNFKITAALDRLRATAGGQYTLTYQPTPPAGTTATVCTDTQVVAGSMACPDGVGFVLATSVAVTSNTFNFPDGAYQLKVVFVSAGGNTASAGFIPIVVDTLRPNVTGVMVQGDANSDEILNIAELPTGNPVVVINTVGVENGQPIVVRLATGAVVSPAVAVTVNNNTATVALSGLGVGNATEADFNLVVVAQDAVGNLNVTANPTVNDPLNTPALVALRVDRVRPGCGFILPNKAALGIADDADGAIAGYQVVGSVSVSTDVQAGGLTLTLAGDVKTPPLSGSIATQSFTVASAGETSYSLICEVKDRAGNANATPNPSVQFLVDLVAPTCTLTAPVTGGGTGSGGEYIVAYDIPTTVSVTNGDGLVARVFATVGATAVAQLDQMVVGSGTAQKTITYSAGAQTVRASVTDGAGNSCSTSQAIVVSPPGCSITFSAPLNNPTFLNKSHDAAPASAVTLEYTVVGATGCPSQQIAFFLGLGAAKTELPGSPLTTSATGGFSFPVSLPEGAQTLTAEMNNGTATARAIEVTVDLTDPIVTGVLPAGANLTFVAPGNFFLRPPANPAYVVDTDFGRPGAQFVVSLNAAGAAGGQVSVLYQGVPVSGPVRVVTASESVSLPVTLAQNTTGSLVVRVTDVGGNNVDQVSTATVDVIAPAAPSVVATLVAGQEREATVNLSWGPVYDDGADVGSGGLVLGPNGGYYDVRWTTSVVSSGLTSTDDFFNSALAYADSTATWSAAVISRNVLTPPLVTTRFYVRARDEVGNYSAFVVAAIGQTVSNPWNTYALNAPPSVAAGEAFGFITAARGSLNNDGFDDLVVTASAANRVFVYYGGPSFGSAGPQELQPPDGVLGNFGFDCAVGNAADDGTGTSKMDLVVGSSSASANAGRALLFFGRNQPQIGTTPADYIVFVGNAASQLGRSAQIVPDVNGDGIDDIFLAGLNEDSNRGHVYLFYGRTEAAWKALPQPIPMSNADRHFLGPTPVPVGGNEFGRMRGGFANLGRLGASGPSDFSIPASRESVNRLFLFSGSLVSAAAAGTVFTTGFADAGVVDTTLQTFGKAPSVPSTRFGYGVRVVGNASVTGTGATDLIVSWASVNSVLIHTDRTGALFPSESTTITGPASSLFGHDVQALDLTADGRTDLVVGQNVAIGADLWVFMNRGVAGSEFDTTSASGFWHAKLNTTAGASALGTSLSSGDFNGDGKQDIAAGDPLDGNGKVIVWYPP